MKIVVYPEGAKGRGREYSGLTPGSALNAYCRDVDPRNRHNLVVIPADDEARKMYDWRSDDDEPAFRLFVASAQVYWDIDPVESFR